MESELAPKSEGQPERSASATRFERTRKVAGWGALSITAAALMSGSAPDGMVWGLLAVIAVVLHVVRTWRS